MAAGRSPFSEVPPKTNCQPRHRPMRLHAARMQTSALVDLKRPGSLPPHHGRLATRAGEAVGTEAVSPSQFICLQQPLSV
jgi:hypothetical protein